MPQSFSLAIPVSRLGGESRDWGPEFLGMQRGKNFACFEITCGEGEAKGIAGEDGPILGSYRGLSEYFLVDLLVARLPRIGTKESKLQHLTAALLVGSPTKDLPLLPCNSKKAF